MRTEFSGYLGNQYIVICAWCRHVYRFDVQMNAASLAKVRAHFEMFDENCRMCGKPLRISWRCLKPFQAEFDAMEKASRWMTTDQKGIPPTVEQLWTWLERNHIEPYEWERDNDGEIDD